MTGPLVQLQAAGTRQETNERAMRQGSQDICTDMQHSIRKHARCNNMHGNLRQGCTSHRRFNVRLMCERGLHPWTGDPRQHTCFVLLRC